MSDDDYDRIHRAYRLRVAQAARRVRHAWPQLWRRVFQPLSATAADRSSPDVAAAGERCNPDVVGWLVMESALLWFAQLSSNPVKRQRELEGQLLAADQAVLEAGRALLLALGVFETTRREAQQARVGFGQGCWDDDLAAALESVASWSPTWASLVGHDDGALREVLRITSETSQHTPGVQDVLRAAFDNVRLSRVWGGEPPLAPNYQGSKPDGEETLAVLFMESLGRIGQHIGCGQSGPLKWLGDKRLTFLLQTVRGDTKNPGEYAVRDARNQVLARRQTDIVGGTSR